MKTLPLNDAPLAILLEPIKNGEEVRLTRGDQVVAKVVPLSSVEKASQFDNPDDVDQLPPDAKRPNPQAGCLKGFWMAPDFDAPLEEFKEYME